MMENGVIADVERQIAEFEAIAEGTVLMGSDGGVWLKPEQSDKHHLEHMVVGLFTGKLVHFSRLGKYKPTSLTTIYKEAWDL